MQAVGCRDKGKFGVGDLRGYVEDEDLLLLQMMCSTFPFPGP